MLFQHRPSFCAGYKGHGLQDPTSWSNVFQLHQDLILVCGQIFSVLRTPDDAWIVHDLVLVWMEAVVAQPQVVEMAKCSLQNLEMKIEIHIQNLCNSSTVEASHFEKYCAENRWKSRIVGQFSDTSAPGTWGWEAARGCLEGSWCVQSSKSWNPTVGICWYQIYQ